MRLVQNRWEHVLIRCAGWGIMSHFEFGTRLNLLLCKYYTEYCNAEEKDIEL